MIIEREYQSNPLRVIVLSNSRSLYSTGRLFEEAFKRGHNVKVYPPLELSLLIARKQSELYFQRERITKPDVLIPRLGTNKPNYTLAVIRQFENMGVLSLNSSRAMGRARDKLYSQQLFVQNNIPVPATFFLDSFEDIDKAIEMVGGAPVIIKVPDGSQGMGVMIAESFRSAKSILETLLNQGTHVLVQEFIEEAGGADTRVIILDGKIITAMRRTSLATDFRSNLHRGGNTEKTELSIEARRIALMAARTMNLKFAGVDLIDSHRGPLILEVNSSPGIEGIEKSSELNIAREVILYLEKMHRDHLNKENL